MEEHSGMRFGAFGRSFAFVMMLRVSSSEGWTFSCGEGLVSTVDGIDRMTALTLPAMIGDRSRRQDEASAVLREGRSSPRMSGSCLDNVFCGMLHEFGSSHCRFHSKSHKFLATSAVIGDWTDFRYSTKEPPYSFNICYHVHQISPVTISGSSSHEGMTQSKQ